MPVPDTSIPSSSPFLPAQTHTHTPMLVLPLQPRASIFFWMNSSPTSCLQSFSSIVARINVQKGKSDHVSPQLKKYFSGFLSPDFLAWAPRPSLIWSCLPLPLTWEHSPAPTLPFRLTGLLQVLKWAPLSLPSLTSHVTLLPILPTPAPPSGASSKRPFMRPRLS